jgi:uncharacterized protein YjbI with pentapeptide repeats
MFKGQFSTLVLLLALGAMPNAASARTVAKDSCQAALNEPEVQADGGAASNTESQFGSNVGVIDGSKISKMSELISAIQQVAGRVPLVQGGNFAGWDFSVAADGLRPVCFFETDLKRTKWDGGKFAGIGFIKAPLDGASFEQAKIEKVLLREAGLAGVVMHGAVLTDGLFDGGWGGSVENWDLTGANMRGFVFQCGITIGDGCPLDRNGTKFVNADLRGADIASYVFWGGADYRGAQVEKARIAPRQIEELAGADFGAGVQLVGGEDKVALNAPEILALQRQIAKAQDDRAKPSFDCGKARNKVEKIICRNEGYNLPGLDRRVAEVYNAVRAKNPASAMGQKKWLAARNVCTDGFCVGDSYEKRLSILMKMLGEPEALKRGESALFYDEQVAFPSEFLQSPLFGKIKSVLFAASMGEALLSRAADGSYAVMGESVGANGHMCSAGGENLLFDPMTGWFAGPSSDAPTKRAAAFRTNGDEIEFPDNGHPDEKQFPGSEDYASCGMRGVLGPLKRIDLGVEALEKRRAAMIGVNG